MTKPIPRPESAPIFPAWPYDCTALYSQVARDFSRYALTAARAGGPVEVLRAEDAYGTSLFRDWIKAYYDLALTPYLAVAASLAARGAQPGTPAEPAGGTRT
jgi:hypothetical protein